MQEKIKYNGSHYSHMDLWIFRITHIYKGNQSPNNILPSEAP
jgi:hypothetical protein